MLSIPADEPDGQPTAEPAAIAGTGNSRKGAATRLRILNAGMMVLVDKGYVGFSASAVADRARLSRMAMLYHFPTLQSLQSALVHHVARLRIDGFIKAIKAVPVTDSFKGQAYRAAVADMAWQQLQSPEFTAFLELITAARTDPMLAEIIHPAIVEYDRSRRQVSKALFPPGSVDDHDFQLARDVVRFLTEGVGQGATIVDDRAERLARLRHFVQMLVATTAGSLFLEQVSADWEQKKAAGETPSPVPGPAKRQRRVTRKT